MPVATTGVWPVQRAQMILSLGSPGGAIHSGAVRKNLVGGICGLHSKNVHGGASIQNSYPGSPGACGVTEAWAAHGAPQTSAQA